MRLLKYTALIILTPSILANRCLEGKAQGQLKITNPWDSSGDHDVLLYNNNNEIEGSVIVYHDSEGFGTYNFFTNNNNNGINIRTSNIKDDNLLVQYNHNNCANNCVDVYIIVETDILCNRQLKEKSSKSPSTVSPSSKAPSVKKTKSPSVAPSTKCAGVGRFNKKFLNNICDKVFKVNSFNELSNFLDDISTSICEDRN